MADCAGAADGAAIIAHALARIAANTRFTKGFPVVSFYESRCVMLTWATASTTSRISTSAKEQTLSERHITMIYNVYLNL